MSTPSVAATLRSIPHPRAWWLASRFGFDDPVTGRRYRRIYHYHIRKTAGTSLNTAFWSLAGLDLASMGRRARLLKGPYVFVRHDRTLIEQGHYFYANSHRPAHALTLPPDTFTVTILRDPTARLLSYYRYLLWAQHDPAAGQQEPFLRELQRDLAWLGSSLGDFLQRAPREHLQRQLFMFSAAFDPEEALERLLACSAVCITEQFSDGLARLAHRTSLPLQAQHARRTSTKLALQPEDVALVSEALGPEIEWFDRARRALSPAHVPA